MSFVRAHGLVSLEGQRGDRSQYVIVTGGGPGNATTFLSQYLTQKAVGQFDLGPAAAFSLIYFLIILLLSWLFYTVMTKDAE